MRSEIKSRLCWLAAAAGLHAVYACGTREIQLEGIKAALTPDDPETFGPGDPPGACITVANLTPDTRYEIRLNGSPVYLSPDGQDAAQSFPGASAMFCLAPGDYNLSLWHEGDSVAQAGSRSMLAGSQHTFVVRGDGLAPTLEPHEVDLSSPGQGLRRMRIENLAADQQPVQFVFENQNFQEIARTPQIAHGDVYETSVSVDVFVARFSDRAGQPVDPADILFPVHGGNIILGEDNVCVEQAPGGFIVLARQVDPEKPGSRGYMGEGFVQHTPVCTPKPPPTLVTQ